MGLDHTQNPDLMAVARRVTDGLEPRNWILFLTLLAGWSVGGLQGIGWGAVSALFAAVLPALFIKRGIVLGRWSDRHVGVIQHRLVVMAFILTSVVTGIGLMVAFSAPRQLIALTVAMFATLAVLTAITPKWKVSVHSAVSAGAIALLMLVIGPWLVVLAPLVALVGWSRVALRDHTIGQVIVGAGLGVAIATATYVAIV